MLERLGISNMFNLTAQLILGEELFDKFGEEINAADAFLKRLRVEFGPPTDIESQSSSKPN